MNDAILYLLYLLYLSYLYPLYLSYLSYMYLLYLPTSTSQQVPHLPLVPLPRIPLVLTSHVLKAPPSPEEEPPSQHDDTSEVRAYVLSRPLLLLRWSLPSLQELTDGEVRSILNDIKSTRLQLAEELQVSNTSHTSPFCTSCTSHTSLICTSHTSPICTSHTSQTSPICTSCTSTGDQ